jgi:hypothetical protein
MDMIAPGTWSASHRACAAGENTSFSPCQSSTGTLMSARLNPHGAQNARASSIHPSADSRSASAKFAAKRARMPTSAKIRRSAAGISGPIAAKWLAGLALISAAVCIRRTVSTSGSFAAAVYSRTLESAIPANQSRPSAAHGARLTRTPARVTRCGRRAAQASACGPPPDRPITANLSRPSALAIASTSGTTSATVRATSRSDQPYPGRSKVIRRTPIS